MPVGVHGQQITFASRQDPDQKYSQYTYVTAKAGQTIQQIAAKHGRPDAVQEILELNRNVKTKNKHHLRSATQPIKANQKIKLPGTLAPMDSFNVLCGDNRPVVKDGYAIFDVVERPGRVGLSRFKGYNPIAIDIEVQFEAYGSQDGTEIEANIDKLERMAGRGNYGGAADGAPAVVAISATDEHGNVVPVIPANYQWSPANPTAPLYRISNISWDAGALSDNRGKRIRQSATITVTQYTPLILTHRSVAQRHKAKKSGGADKKPKPIYKGWK